MAVRAEWDVVMMLTSDGVESDAVPAGKFVRGARDGFATIIELKRGGIRFACLVSALF